MQVTVGSKNPVKLQATKNVLDKIYPELTIKAVNADSGVPNQPFGLDQTIEGAINRAKNAYKPRYRFISGNRIRTHGNTPQPYRLPRSTMVRHLRR